MLKNIRRQTRRQYSAEEKIRIVLEGLRGEENISELCRREGIAASMYYGWSKEFLEAGKRRLAGDTARAATSGEVKEATQSGAHAIDRMLRKDLKYEGVVMTDDLAMRAVVDEKKSASAAAIEAIKAGADMVVISRLQDDDQTFDVGAQINEAITAQVCTNEIPISVIKRSVGRLQRLKSRFTQKHRREDR